MDSLMRQFIRDSGLEDPHADPALAKAQNLVQQAYESDDPEAILDLAMEALKICPECADAYVLLAEMAPSPEDALEVYEAGVAAGEAALGGPAGLKRWQGHFWGVLETRPYMRARLGLAQTLWSLGKRNDAMEHCRALLKLNPDDNQGVRYVLASYYCQETRNDDLDTLLRAYEKDGSAEWHFSRALLAFRRQGDSAEARRLLQVAHRQNPHVVNFLLGGEQVPSELPPYVSHGDRTEAVSYASAFLPGWRATAGAVTWVRNALNVPLTENLEPRRPTWAFLKGSVSELPQAADEVWQVDVRRMTARTGSHDWQLVAVSVGEAIPVVLEMYGGRKPAAVNALLDLLLRMRTPHTGEPRRPAQVQIRQKSLQKAWQPKLAEIGVTCELREDLESLEIVLTDLDGAMENPRLTPADVADRTHEIADLPQVPEEVWQADARKLAAWITAEGAPKRPRCAIVANRSEGVIVGQDLCAEEPAHDWLARAVLGAMLAPMTGDPHRPGCVQVASEERRAALEGVLEPFGVACEVHEQLDQLDFIYQQLAEHMAEPHQMAAMIDSPGVTERHVAGLFDAAAQYYRRAPWRSVPSDEVLVVHCDALQTHTWYAVVMGQSGMTLGLALYEDRQILAALLREEADAQRRQGGMSIIYSEAFEIAVRDLDAAEQHGWPVAGPEAYPLVLRINPGLAVRPPLAWELELAEGCLRAIPVLLQRPDKTPARMTVPVAEGEMTLDLSWEKR
jgi:tetratricopeptide (TPR) repeat protein